MIAAARIVLTDWNSGRIPYFTHPPTRGDKTDFQYIHAAEVVTNWGRGSLWLSFYSEPV
jgi:nuclear GTP-binding protein